MVIVHFVGAIISLIGYHSISTVHSEGAVCKFIFPLQHFSNFILNMVMVIIYLSTMISSTSITSSDIYSNFTNLGILLGAFAGYHLYLKFLSVWTCNFWVMRWSSVMAHFLLFLLEGVFVSVFFGWYNRKTLLITNMMKTSAKYLV